MSAPGFSVVSDPKPKPDPRRYCLLTAADLARRPPMRWIIKGVLPAIGLASIYGPSGSGKTFLALDLAAATAEGVPWMGHRTRPTGVIYAALEGEAGIAKRAAAWQAHHGRPLPERLRFVTEPFSLLDVRDVPDLAETIDQAGGAGLVVLDTLNRASGGADENSSRDMGALIASATDLQRLTGGLVLLVHHTGKDATKGARGHSSLFAALDSAVEVTRNGDSREWRVAKSKDGEDGQAFPFCLEPVTLGQDEDGDTITSCVALEGAGENHCGGRRFPPNSANMRIALDAISAALKDARKFGQAGAPQTRPCVHYDDALLAVAAVLPVPEKRRSERAASAITSLVSGRYLAHQDGWVWLP